MGRSSGRISISDFIARIEPDKYHVLICLGTLESPNNACRRCMNPWGAEDYFDRLQVLRFDTASLERNGARTLCTMAGSYWPREVH